MEAQIDSSTVEVASDGRAWVDRFLQPLLAQRFSSRRPLHCLQVAPEDPSEAFRLEERGHTCVMAEMGLAHTLPFPDANFDFAFTGKFSLLAADPTSRTALAREFFRVIRDGGALLVLIGNRWCPLDLSRNGPLFHIPTAGRGLSYAECARTFVDQAGFASIAPIGLGGHFGWGSLPHLLRPLGRLLDAYWRHLATPSRKWLYTSALNPTFLLWLNKR